LNRVCQEGSFLGGIPDIIIPGFETTNGSLGQGLGVACGISLALKRRNADLKVFVLLGDGELYEGSVWEAIMFASEHKLNNLIVIVDNNKICMLDYCKNIIDLAPLEEKFKLFKWKVGTTIDGHDVEAVYNALQALKEDKGSHPKVLIADTVKGKGVPQLERDSLCHTKSLKEDEINVLLRKLK
jgi:transketolase